MSFKQYLFDKLSSGIYGCIERVLFEDIADLIIAIINAPADAIIFCIVPAWRVRDIICYYLLHLYPNGKFGVRSKLLRLDAKTIRFLAYDTDRSWLDGYKVQYIYAV